MKTNFKFKLGKIAINAIEIEGAELEIETEYNLNELHGSYGLIKKALKELPEMIADLGEGLKVYEEIESEMRDKRMAECNYVRKSTEEDDF